MNKAVTKRHKVLLSMSIVALILACISLLAYNGMYIFNRVGVPMESIKIQQTTYDPTLEKLLMQGLNSEAIKATGIDGWDPERIVFSARSGKEIIGAIVVQIIYSQLHIEYMLVLDEHRHKGVGSQLMHTALKYGKDNGCTFAYLETLSFQAPEFYEKMGFKREFSRAGFADGILFHYYRREI